MSSRLQTLFEQKKEKILSMFFTSGYPKLEDTRPILSALAASGVDLVEIGMPFSDPIADGDTIQMSSQQALDNGITLDKIFAQLEGVREEMDIPLILMGYLNPVMQYGIERFVTKAASLGIDGVILPDLPMYEYQMFYKDLFDKHGLANIFLITPQTSEQRIREIDALSTGFIYMVSSASTTGKVGDVSSVQEAYFERIKAMGLRSPLLIGFGIHDHASFTRACEHAQGAIIGSALIKALSQGQPVEEAVRGFVGAIHHPL
ncbi:MAG: tryptophan synthase subunit alpha [Bacteroidia bacterium]|nr:tryptophan synthase subunit alpha [Bacteroidia bacterium]